MMKRNILLYIVTILLLGVHSIAAQTESGVKVLSADTKKSGEALSVNMELALDQLKLGSQQMITITPQIVGNKEQGFVQNLPSVVVSGNTRYKILQRMQALGNPLPFDATSTQVQKLKDARRVSYSQQVAVASWMKDASLKLCLQVSGCANCDGGKFEIPLLDNVIHFYDPQYRLTYIVPEVEPVKARADKYVATINFRQDKDVIDRAYMNNTAILNEADSIVRMLYGNKDLKVSDFEIVGYASPEASVQYNKSLAERRSRAFAQYLRGRHNIPASRMKVSGYGEDWDKTREVIAASNINDKMAILNIIDRVANPDARDAELMKLSDGATYQTMLTKYYPKVRRTEYTVSYEVRAFDVEEAKKVIKTNPKHLSLNEMYLVANTYPANSPEFKEVFDIAVRIFPDQPVAIVNASAIDIEAGAYQVAVDRMLKIRDDYRVWNNIGVGLSRLGRYDEARAYFVKAAAKGDAEAKHNLSELDKLIAEL